MKKKLNVDSIQSELRGGSAFFPGYKGADSPTPPSSKPKATDTGGNVGAKATVPVPQEAVQKGVPPPVPPEVRGTVPPPLQLVPKVKRPIKQRQPFDIYEDQYEQLKRIAASEKDFINGRSMSQMVRDAIDLYFRDHASSKK
jgi:hypothetical protein